MGNTYKDRLSYKRYKKMLAHICEQEAFFHTSMGALKNMIEVGIEEERSRKRKPAKKGGTRWSR